MPWILRQDASVVICQLLFIKQVSSTCLVQGNVLKIYGNHEDEQTVTKAVIYVFSFQVTVKLTPPPPTSHFPPPSTPPSPSTPPPHLPHHTYHLYHNHQQPHGSNSIDCANWNYIKNFTLKLFGKDYLLCI